MADLRAAVDDAFPKVRQDLDRLVRIPSVSAPGFDPGHVHASAEATAEILEAAGLGGVRLLEIEGPGAGTEGTHPAVFGEHPAPAGAPTVLLYAHHDVQPPGDEADWDSPPFEPTERDGRLFGRGACDDKAGVVLHQSSLMVHDGRPPVGVKVFIEGEEEVGSPNLPDFLERYGEELRADVFVLADATNWRAGVPGLTTRLRGLVDCEVEVRTLDHAVHSGMYGGPFPDALSALSRLLATLHDDRGNVAVEGLASGPADPLDLTEAELREQAGALPGVELIGEGAITERLWTRPAVSVLAIDAPRVGEASNTLVPVARAKVSLRLAPGDDPDRAMEALVKHLEANAPWGARVTVRPGAAAWPYAVRAEGAVFDAARSAFAEAWGADPVDMGAGGTIPFVKAFAEAYPDAAILLTGVEDPDGRAHGANESLLLDDFRKACLAQALLLEHLAT
ncbi:MAG TPA: dipeptidase [Actinomycetota bacterium]|nr:dipeptidase [Actinomycetota bacterium]